MSPMPERLRRGIEFERIVCDTYLPLLTSGETVAVPFAVPKYARQRLSGRRGWVDILVSYEQTREQVASDRAAVEGRAFPADSNRTVIVFEVKATDWDAIHPANVRRNVMRHRRQVLSYVDHFRAEMQRGAFYSVQGSVVYPKRPTHAGAAELVEEVLLEEGIVPLWLDEVR